MKLQHFEAYAPTCVTCQTELGPLEIVATRSNSREVHEGLLRCPNPHCRREYPIIDGMPILIKNIREYLEQHIYMIRRRRDFEACLESLLGDASPAHSYYESQKQILSTYTFDHYGDLDPELAQHSPAPAQVVQVTRSCLALLRDSGAEIGGRWLDLGCGPGRSSFTLAQECDSVLGIDFGFGLLQVAQDMLSQGATNLDLRQLGRVYKRYRLERNSELSPESLQAENLEKVDFWIADVTALPFRAKQIDGLLSLNLLDCVKEPVLMVQNCASVLKPGKPLALATPYDWTEAVTPIEHWFGGHSQRHELEGDGGRILRRVLDSQGFQTLAQGDSPWSLRLHARSSMNYAVQTTVAKKLESDA